MIISLIRIQKFYMCKCGLKYTTCLFSEILIKGLKRFAIANETFQNLPIGKLKRH